MPLRAGEVFADYRIVRQLGAGGMGSVYLARHPRLPRQDALKVLTEGASVDREFRARFIREAELASRLAHPNIVAIHDRGVFEDVLWIAMQFVEGGDVAQLVRQGPLALPPERTVHIIGEAARGLDAAHAAGLLHRDVKPANILVAPRPGAPDRVLVTDFGIARAAGESTVLTAAGEVLATVAYAAPEQISGSGAMDQRVDVYALGGTLYHMLTGTAPFARTTPTAVMHAHLVEPPPRPSAVNPSLPPQFDAVIARAMAKNPDVRYPSCGALAAAAFAALRGELTESVPTPAPPRPRRRTKLAIVIGAAICAVALAIVATTWAVTSDDSGSSASTVAATTSPKRTAPAVVDDKGPWGPYGYMIAAFPDLLPRTPIGLGHQGLRCIAADPGGVPRPLDAKSTFGWLSCNGDGDPLAALEVYCVSSHIPFRTAPPKYVTKLGEQRWTRGSAVGDVSWGDTADRDGRPRGTLEINFDTPDRNFCNITAYSYEESGQALYERWWPDAPL